VSTAARTPEELLQRARDRAEPDAGEAGRVRARLRAQMSAPSAGSESPLAAPDAPSGVPDALRSVPDALRSVPDALRSGAPSRLAPALRWSLLGAAGVVLFGAGFLLGRLSVLPSDTTAAPDASRLATPNPAAGVAPLGADPHPAPAPAASTAAVAAPSAPTPELRAPRSAPPRSVPPRSAPPRGAPPRASATGLATNEPLKEALRRLRRAQRALYDNDAARALAVLADLDRRVAPPVLGEEREMTRILALCGTGELAEARALAQRWVAEHPQSIYLARLQDSCVEPAEGRASQ
jgi:hypothetical protein